MIIHIAIYKWKSGTTEKTINEAIAEVRALKEKVDGVLDIRCGKNFSRWNEGYTHAFVVFARDKTALEAYRNHPDHIEVAQQIDSMDAGSIGIDFAD